MTQRAYPTPKKIHKTHNFSKNHLLYLINLAVKNLKKISNKIKLREADRINFKPELLIVIAEISNSNINQRQSQWLVS